MGSKDGGGLRWGRWVDATMRAELAFSPPPT